MATLIQNPPRVRVEHGLTLAPPPAEAGAWARFYEEQYQEAAGDAGRLSWADLTPCPALQAWLNSEAPSLVRPGAAACVVGCGMGDDVQELADRGYDVVGFDVSSTAVQWARARH